LGYEQLPGVPSDSLEFVVTPLVLLDSLEFLVPPLISP
jgi:hypothetical protein